MTEGADLWANWGRLAGAIRARRKQPRRTLREGKSATQFRGGPGSEHSGLLVGIEGAGELGKSTRGDSVWGEGGARSAKVGIGRGLLV